MAIDAMLDILIFGFLYLLVARSNKKRWRVIIALA
jgi:hypothetical protein